MREQLTRIKPIGENILVEVVDERVKVAGGFEVTGKARDESPAIRGKVLAIPAGLEETIEDEGVEVFPLEVGCIVLFREFAGSGIISPQGVELRLVEYRDILAIEEKV